MERYGGHLEKDLYFYFQQKTYGIWKAFFIQWLEYALMVKLIVAWVVGYFSYLKFVN
jgi:hypothetical protein